MTSENIIKEYTELGRLKANEAMLGEQMIQLTADQRKAHLATLAQQDKIYNLENDRQVAPVNKRDSEDWIDMSGADKHGDEGNR